MYKKRKLEMRLGEYLDQINMSEAELARRTSISQARLNEFINGKRKRIDVSYLEKIAEELDIELDQIMTLTIAKNKNL
ncbi:helix-turn-helix domain-containing protein [Marinilactibacillus psychrotolerans]|uniref:helix-turn-helix domain-containing protein n=1 Tax=Marinilactibacillus psychrotolerans TaxID=191770 RepID=UPI001867E99C|nr:helix-turn-helix transcriptional regulator [Marinilactibacillus psychrotolerans]GEQ33364.1 hypothetical protein B795N_12460 [Marinilactibacillus psychrotolerans]